MMIQLSHAPPQLNAVIINVCRFADLHVSGLFFYFCFLLFFFFVVRFENATLYSYDTWLGHQVEDIVYIAYVLDAAGLAHRMMYNGE